MNDQKSKSAECRAYMNVDEITWWRHLLVMQALTKPVHHMDHATVTRDRLVASYRQHSTLQRSIDSHMNEMPSF